MAVNYVKFYRGSELAFENAIKNPDTLYFISSSDSQTGKLYLGEKLISGGVGNIADLQDIILTNLGDKQLLVYNAATETWENKSVTDAIGIMVGATESNQGFQGLVPAPGKGQQELFLRGDGTWAEPIPQSSILNGDGISVEIVDNVIQLKNFNNGYYAYIPAVKNPESGEIITNSDYVYTSGFKNGLEARVIELISSETGEKTYSIAWYEPSTETVDDLSALIEALNQDIDNLEANVYTKLQVDSLIANAAHLKRVIVDSIDNINVNDPKADQYIYMVKRINTDNNDSYDEYMVINGKVEKVGSWGTDLSDYVKKEEGKSLVSDTEIAKLATIEEGAQKNYITSTSENFSVSSVGKLSLVSIPSDLKLDSNNDFKLLQTKVINLETTVQNLDDKYVTKTLYQVQVGNINNLIHATGEDDSTIIDEINFINERLQWHDISNV